MITSEVSKVMIIRHLFALHARITIDQELVTLQPVPLAERQPEWLPPLPLLKMRHRMMTLGVVAESEIVL